MDNILKTARRDKGLTQAQVAAALGRDQSTVSKYETGAARPDADIAPAYAALLGIGVLDVLYPEMPPATQATAEIGPAAVPKSSLRPDIWPAGAQQPAREVA